MFEDCWERTKKITGWKKLADLAAFLGITAASVSGAKKRNTFPVEWAYKIAKKYRQDTDWILTGKGENNAVDINIDKKTFNGDSIRVSEKIQKTIEILESETIYRTAMAANIDAFHHAVQQDDQVRKNEKELQAQQTIIKGLEARISSLEKLLSSVSATPGDYRKKTKDNAA